jgi:hypothetical protein
MARHILFSVLAVAMLSGSVSAQENGFGLGLILGEPTGVSLKTWVTDNAAMAGAVAWSFGKKDALHLHADYLIHDFRVIRMEEDNFPLYYGIGGRIRFEENDKIGVRIPVGMNYLFTDAPLDIFLEIVPLLNLAPSTDFDLNGAIGVRYFFGQRSHLPH